MKTPASTHGHPVHPMLVTLPIGLWLSSFFCDLIYLLGGGNPVWSTVALHTMAGGLVGAAAAAVPGLLDLLSLDRGAARRTALLGMALKVTVVALYAVNFFFRLQSDQPATGLVGVSALALILLAVSGWLGGRMVHELAVGASAPSPSARQDPKRPVRMVSRGT